MARPRGAGMGGGRFRRIPRRHDARGVLKAATEPVVAERAKLNGVQCERIDSDQLRELEPAAAGIAALHVPETGIVNYRSVCHKLAQILRTDGVSIELDFELRGIKHLKDSLELTAENTMSWLLTVNSFVAT